LPPAWECAWRPCHLLSADIPSRLPALSIHGAASPGRTALTRASTTRPRTCARRSSARRPTGWTSATTKSAATTARRCCGASRHSATDMAVVKFTKNSRGAAVPERRRAAEPLCCVRRFCGRVPSRFALAGQRAPREARHGVLSERRRFPGAPQEHGVGWTPPRHWIRCWGHPQGVSPSALSLPPSYRAP